MEFTAQEQRMLERLRKQERQWHWARWVLLLGGCFIVATYFVIVSMIWRFVQREEMGDTGLLVLALIFPKVLLGLVFGSVSMGLAWRDWHGNTTRTLLLKLVDHCSRERAANDHAA